MDNETYSELAMRTAPTPATSGEMILVPLRQWNMLLGIVGLMGEAGEIAELIKKHVFHGHPLDAVERPRVIKEMGDVEWYANLLRCLFGTTLEEVHATNIQKLSARYPEGFFTSERSMHRAAGDV